MNCHASELNGSPGRCWSISLVSVVLSDHSMNEETRYPSEFDDLDPRSS